MDHNQILFPLFALFTLTLLVLLRLGYLRVKSVKNKEIDPRHFKLMRGDKETPELAATSRNLINLLETPVLFYTGCLMAFVATQPTTIMVATAWIYVVFRYLHTIVHISSNHMPTRFAFFVISLGVLAALWIEIFFHLV